MIVRTAAVAWIAALLALPAFASEAPDWAHRIPGELMSPFCPGVTLAECTSGQASQLKMWILVQAAAGSSEEEVREELYARYGDQIRPTPKAEGMGIAAYVIPIVVFFAGGALVTVFLRRRTAGTVATAAPAAPLDPERERRLDEVLTR